MTLESGDEFYSKRAHPRMGQDEAFKVYRVKVATDYDVFYEWRWKDSRLFKDGGRKPRFLFETMVGERLCLKES